MSHGPPAARERRVPLVIGVTCALAAILTFVGWVVDGPPRDLIATCVLGALLMASWAVSVEVIAKVQVGSSSIVSLASFVLVGPVGSAVIGAASVLFEVGSKQLKVRVFNTAMAGLLGALGGLTYLVSGGARDLTALDGAGELLTHVGLPLMVANVVQSLANLSLVAAIVWASTGESFRRYFGSMLRTSGLSQTGFGVIGFLFVILWVPAGVGPVSAALILLPLFVARWAYVQYGEEQRAHERTMAALVAAGETGDPHAVGHGERVAQLSERLGEELGVPQRSALRYAALLHDIGLVSAPELRHLGVGATAIDVGAVRDDPLVQASINDHPVRGVELVRDIAFLEDALPGIRHHHERWDGFGYPDGLAGEEIPLIARIVAVADSFDSLTHLHSTRAPATVEQALACLRLRSGSQLDPMVLVALERVVEKQTWAPQPTPEASAPASLVAIHDDPGVSDLLAAIDRAADQARR